MTMPRTCHILEIPQPGLWSAAPLEVDGRPGRWSALPSPSLRGSDGCVRRGKVHAYLASVPPHPIEDHPVESVRLALEDSMGMGAYGLRRRVLARTWDEARQMSWIPVGLCGLLGRHPDERLDRYPDEVMVDVAAYIALTDILAAEHDLERPIHHAVAWWGRPRPLGEPAVWDLRLGDESAELIAPEGVDASDWRAVARALVGVPA